MKKNFFRKVLVILVIVFFISIIIVPSISANISEVKDDFNNIKFKDSYESYLEDDCCKNTLCLIIGKATHVHFTTSPPDRKLCILNAISFWGSWPEPSSGLIFTIGLNGIQVIKNRGFCGVLGVLGFTGIKQKLSDEPDSNGWYNYSFIGFALRVDLLKM